MAPEAVERLARVAIVKPENARAVEDHLLRLARSGKLSAKITEDDVIRILDELSKQAGAGGGAAKKVVITRKKRDEDDDDDDDDF
jgi:programmed cell death protein 5